MYLLCSQLIKSLPSPTHSTKLNCPCHSTALFEFLSLIHPQKTLPSCIQNNLSKSQKNSLVSRCLFSEISPLISARGRQSHQEFKRHIKHLAILVKILYLSHLALLPIQNPSPLEFPVDLLGMNNYIDIFWNHTLKQSMKRREKNNLTHIDCQYQLVPDWAEQSEHQTPPECNLLMVH